MLAENIVIEITEINTMQITWFHYTIGTRFMHTVYLKCFATACCINNSGISPKKKQNVNNM